MAEESKRITLKVTDKQHKFIRGMSKPNGITQEELLGLMIDVLSVNPKAIEPHIVRFRQRKVAEEQRKKDMEAKASKLVGSLTPEMQARLLSGDFDVEALQTLLKQGK